MLQRKMTPPIRVQLWACVVVAMMSVIGAVHGRTIQLNWTSDGVRDYTRYVRLPFVVWLIIFLAMTLCVQCAIFFLFPSGHVHGVDRDKSLVKFSINMGLLIQSVHDVSFNSLRSVLV